jgi:purine-nucleoside phosphorylase
MNKIEPGFAAAAVRLQDALNAAGAATVHAVVIAGSGMGSLWNGRRPLLELDYSELPDFPRHAVPGQEPRLEVHLFSGQTVILFRGRLHVYQGFDPWHCAAPVRLAAALGARFAVGLCAAGALNPAYKAGEFLVIRDHLNQMGDNIGSHFHDGPHYLALNRVYDGVGSELAVAALREAGLQPHEGILVAVRGPLYETPAEVRVLQQLGADAVSMSIIPEATAATALGMKFAALALLTNRAAGLDPAPPSHDEVESMGRQLAEKLSQPLEKMLTRWLGG